MTEPDAARTRTYDLVVIGAGSGGLVAAAGAAALGVRVALVEARDGLGGDCAYFGCVPSKALLKAAKVAHLTRRAEEFGLPAVTLPPIDFPKVMARVRDTIEHFTSGPDSAERFASLGVDVYLGERARFIGPRSIYLGETRLEASRVVIATGGRPAIPPIPGLPDVPYLTNETLFEHGLERLPESIVIAGAGPIGVEIAQAFHRLGSRVTLVEPMDCILSREDHELACWLRRHLQLEGIDIRVNTRVTSVARDPSGVRVSLTTSEDTRHRDDPQPAPLGSSTLTAEAILLATGRRPNIEGLDLEKAGIETGRQGIVVDKHLRTSAPGVYAIGDVTGGLLFTHVAAAHAVLAVRNAFFPLATKWDPSGTPWATFSDPELAHVGITEDEAREQGIPHVVHRWSFDEVDRAITEGEAHGFFKVVATPKGRILGAHIVGPEAGELIHEFALALKHGLTVGEIARTIHVYPTLSHGTWRVAGQHYRAAFEKHKELLRMLMRLKGVKARVNRVEGAIHRAATPAHPLETKGGEGLTRAGFR